MKELTKFQKWFLDVMNKQGGAKGCVIFGLTALAISFPIYVIHSVLLIKKCSEPIEIIFISFGMVCVLIVLVFLIKMLIFVSKHTNFFK